VICLIKEALEEVGKSISREGQPDSREGQPDLPAALHLSALPLQPATENTETATPSYW